VGLLTGHTTLRADMFELGLTQCQGCQLCEDGKEDSVLIVSLSDTGMQKMPNVGSGVFETQGSGDYEDEQP